MNLRILVLLIATAACASVTARAAAGLGGSRPALLLSVYRAAPGTAVRIKGVRCPRLYAQADELTWHDSYQLRNREATPPYRLVRPLHRVGETITATFVVRRTDHLGQGLLDLFCGGSGGNATAFLTVVR